MTVDLNTPGGFYWGPIPPAVEQIRRECRHRAQQEAAAARNRAWAGVLVRAHNEGVRA